MKEDFTSAEIGKALETIYEKLGLEKINTKDMSAKQYSKHWDKANEYIEWVWHPNYKYRIPKITRTEEFIFF